MAEQLKHRSEVPVRETWDLTAIFATEDDFENAFAFVKTEAERIAQTYQGRLSSAETINRCLDDYAALMTVMEHVGNYANLAMSVDYTDSDNRQRNARMGQAFAIASAQLSFIESEILQQPEAVIDEAIAMDGTGKHYLQDIKRRKPHTLPPECEKLLSALGQTLGTPYELYETAKLADITFPNFTVDGKEYPLGYSLFEDSYQYNGDTAVRRAAFDAFSKKISEYKNVTAAAYNAQVQKEKVLATQRGFDSVIDYLLFDQKVTRDMYERQIDTIMTQLAPHMRRYAELLQKAYGLEKMTYADLKLPLVTDYDRHLTLDEAREMLMHHMRDMGEEYVDLARRAFDDRYVDFANNIGKSTGGFCASPYQKHSYILLSWHERMSDLFTLAHELGHAGHFARCQKTQNVLDTDVSTYFVEAPSTMNELMFAHSLMRENTDPAFRRWVLSNIVGNTYYHNFVTHLLEAAYQREVYRLVDKGESVTAEVLSAIKKDVLHQFWGDAVELNDGCELTWMRQPHYYMGLYSYTYSAGLTIGTQMQKRIAREGLTAVEDWKKALDAGGTLTPAELAKIAGVDVEKNEALEDTIATIGAMIDEMEKLG